LSEGLATTGFGQTCAAILGEKPQQRVHLLIIRSTLDDPALAIVIDHPGPTQDMQVTGKGGSRQARRCRKFADRHALLTGLNEQAEEVQAVLLGQGVEACECIL
jgi:hypothetical protein